MGSDPDVHSLPGILEQMLKYTYCIPEISNKDVIIKYQNTSHIPRVYVGVEP